MSALKPVARSESLRDATLDQIRHNKRARHVVTENQRVEDFVEAAKAGDLNRMGQLFVESHRSMRDDYEISCEEIDFLVETAARIPGCYGARMTGGGFGGSTVNLVAPERGRRRYQSDTRTLPKHVSNRPSGDPLRSRPGEPEN